MNYILTILLHGLRNDFQSPTSIAAKILLLVGCLALGALPSDAAPRANQGPAPTAQQVEVLLLSSRDPDSADINALINQAESEMVGGFKKAAHFSLEYVDPLSLADAPQHYIVDWQQLRRWGIGERTLSPNGTLLNRKYSARA